MENNSRNQNPKSLEDLIFHEVLPRIPTKSLLRFITVSHRWYAFIKSVDFLKTHVRHLPSLNSRSILTLDASLSFFHFFDYGEGSIAEKKFGLIQSDSTIQSDSIIDCLLSSCNGVVFLVRPSDFYCRSGFDYVLYNPVVGPDDFVKIPHPAAIRLGSENLNRTHGFGFGYVSSTTEDYYIVAVDLPGGLDVVVNLYSVRYRRWRHFCAPLIMLEEYGLPLQFNKSWYRNTATLIKEALYWGITQGKTRQSIFGFDLANHRYCVLCYPTFGRQTTDEVVHVSDRGLCCLNDCLGAWGKYKYNKEDVVDLWILKPQHELQNLLWTKLCRIDLDSAISSPRDFFGLGKTGLFLMYTDDDSKIRLVDLQCDRPLPVLKNEWNAVNYVPSLESVLAMTVKAGAK